jgi:dienelactone hydrolase
MRGALTLVDTTSSERRDGYQFHTLSLGNDRGVVTTAGLKTPAVSGRRHPALVILGGLRTGSRTIEYLGDTGAMVLLALDYPYEGKRERLSAREFVAALPRMRRAVIETVPAVSMGVDYLLSRDDVDPDRIALVGGSLGAVFVPAAAASDHRIAAAAILFGAGDIEHLLRANIDLPGWLAAPAAWAGAVLTSPVEPLKYVADISPRPLLMLNGIGDPRVPSECTQRLHATAREPKTTRWIEAGHVSVRDREFHERVRAVLVDWLTEHGYMDQQPG